MSVAAAVRRYRLRAKTPPAVVPPPALRAIADEGWSELTSLDESMRRKHVHWTHVRTGQPAHRQPDTLTREEFWHLLVDAYKDIYPEEANKTGSIVLFGLVVKEHHAASQQEPLRAEHHHCAAYTSTQHYWRPVAQRALEKHRLKLHAACHDGYASMYVYLRFPTSHKPVTELDATPFFSPEHPQGLVLQRLLNSSAHAERAVRGNKRGGSAAAEAAAKRFRGADVYEFAVRTGVRTSAGFLGQACAAAAQGDNRLAEFCTVHTAEELQRFLDQAWP